MEGCPVVPSSRFSMSSKRAAKLGHCFCWALAVCSLPTGVAYAPRRPVLTLGQGFQLVAQSRTQLEAGERPFLQPPREVPADSGRVLIGREQAHDLGIVGFEGSFYTRTSDGTYHFLSAGRLNAATGWSYREKNVHMRFDHWFSADGMKWEHGGKLHESSGVFDGSDRRGSTWAPMAAFDRSENRWHLYYVGYRASEDYRTKKNHFYDQYDGAIFHAISSTSGESGIGGPYEDAGDVMDQETHGGFDSSLDSWEGDHGVDMFFPFQSSNGTWLALYGSEFGRAPHFCNPVCRQVALARLEGASLRGGQWLRMHGKPLDAAFRPAKPGIENPVVGKTSDDNFFVAIYHVYNPGAVGISFSEDGLEWQRQDRDVHLVRAGSGPSFCDDDVTTAGGLVPEPSKGPGWYSVMYTAGGGGAGADGFGVICRAYLVNRNEGEEQLPT